MDKPAIRERQTIMDGTVVEFARRFTSEIGMFGERFEAAGPYHISASRNAVVVHRADLQSREDVEEFLFAVGVAETRAAALSREGLGGNYRRGMGASTGGTTNG